jgi:Fic family protein
LNWIRESNLIEGVDDAKEDERSKRAWEWFLTQDLNETSVLRLHDKIMQKKLPHRDRGVWRNCDVMIGIRTCPAWRAVPNLMLSWFVTAHVPHFDMTEVDIQILHIEFERIHPFVDGNGRTGRMVMNYQRVKLGLEPLLIKANERQAYYKWFEGGPIEESEEKVSD